MAGFAEALQVPLIPEQRFVSAMRHLVVGNQFRGIDLNLTAAYPLAGEVITYKNRHPQLLPASGLVPLAPADILVAGAKPGGLIAYRSTYSR